MISEGLLEIQLCITGIIYILKFIRIEIVIIFHIIAVFTAFVFK